MANAKTRSFTRWSRFLIDYFTIMALHFLNFFILFLFMILISSFSEAKAFPQIRPNAAALVLPVTKVSYPANQYIIQIYQRTPHIPLKLTLDLGADKLWVDCQTNYKSSSFRSVNCHSAHCTLARSSDCGNSCTSKQPSPWYCNKNACFVSVENSIYMLADGGGEVAEDVFSFRSTNGQVVTAPRFVFACGTGLMVRFLGKGVKGMAGLGRSLAALPTQLAQSFGFQRKFTICLGSSTKTNGFISFGDLSVSSTIKNSTANAILKSLSYTPLILNPVGTPRGIKWASSDYFIGVKSIKINGKTVPINTTLLSFDKEGNGGTKISTVIPYTALETSIYKAVTEAFVKELISSNVNVKRVARVTPFDVCFKAKSILGTVVPSIDLVLHRQNVYWRISGANSMVKVSKDVMCLGIVESFPFPFESIVIGARQIEDNLLEFDLSKARLGFSSLLSNHNTCANFNTLSHS